MITATLIFLVCFAACVGVTCATVGLFGCFQDNDPGKFPALVVLAGTTLLSLAGVVFGILSAVWVNT